MKTELIKITRINDEEKYLLSYPVDSSRCETLLSIFPFTNFVVLDKENRIIFGFEFIKYFKEQDKKEIEVIRTDRVDKEALILAYNYKEKLFGFNLYEKLNFLKKILNFISIQELYKRINIDISVNEILKKNLRLLTSTELKKSLISDSINLISAMQICRWNKEDRTLIIDLFSKTLFSKSHQLKIIEMFEELMFKEKTNARSIYKKLNIDDLLKEEKPQKKIVDKIFSFRYPIYRKEAEIWKQNIDKLKLPSNITVTHYPFFEKKDIELKIRVKKIEDIEKIVKLLSKQRMETLQKNNLTI